MLSDSSPAFPIDAFYEAVILVDSTALTVCACNRRAAELFRAPSPDSLIGLRLCELSPETARGLTPETLENHLTGHAFRVSENVVLRRDGTPFLGEAATRRMRDGRLMISIRDISLRNDMLQKVEAANERLRSHDRERMKFVSNVSHELRTPLTSMSYALINLKRGLCGELPPKAAVYVERLQADVKRLMTTVNDLLDLRQIENGTLTLNRETLPVGRLIQSVATAISIQSETKHQTFTVEPTSPECFVSGDRHKLERVFFNIYSNAIKYTPEGGAVSVFTETDGDSVHIIVDDTGIGIPKQALPRVSQRYFRVGTQVNGTGLGLAIVREIAELHNGTLFVASPVPGTDVGTRVILTLPRCEGPLILLISEDTALAQRLTEAAAGSGCLFLALRPDENPDSFCEGQSVVRFVLDGRIPPHLLHKIISHLRESPTLCRHRMLIPGAPENTRHDFAHLHIGTCPLPMPADALNALFCDCGCHD